jgi:riboflavin biosynthesis pyrimidine reductase
MADDALLRLYPQPATACPLEGLYLTEELRPRGVAGKPFVYTNFVASLDGRVAVYDAERKAPRIPDALTNPRDWRLYQELVAQADVVVVSARHGRAMMRDAKSWPFPFEEPAEDCRLKQWRLDRQRDECPALAIVSSALNLSAEALARYAGWRILCLTGSDAPEWAASRLEDAGVEVIRANAGHLVTGRALVDALDRRGFRAICSVAGAGVMRALLADRVLARLYLTQVHRLIGGTPFDSLVEAESLSPAPELTLAALYHDAGGGGSPAQTYATYDLDWVEPGACPSSS